MVLNGICSNSGNAEIGCWLFSQALAAACLRALAERNAFDPADVDDVVMGCVNQAGDQGACIARMSVLLAGWPNEVPGVR